MVDPINDHLLALKVMRLARPKFHENVCMAVDPADEMSQLIGSAICKMTGQESADEPISQYLIAPQVFEKIYLGETFTFYVCVQNTSSQTASKICVKTDLQTTNQRLSLSSNLDEAHAVLEPGQSLGEIISQEIKEVGQHILVCAVTYSTSNEEMVLRKFFKFPVEKPIDVRTKFYNADDNVNSDVYLEAEIQNMTLVPMVLEKVTLEPSDFYTVSEVPPPTFRDDDFLSQFYLNPNDVQQFLYCLRPKTDNYSLNHYRGGTAIGKLDMIWRTSMGERGRLQTNTLQRMAPGYGDLRLTIEKIPSSAKVRCIFDVICRLQNCSEQSLDLILTLDNSIQPNLIFCCTSGVRLGQLPPNGTVDFALEILATVCGLQSISGIRITDAFRNRTYEHDDIAQIFIT